MWKLNPVSICHAKDSVSRKRKGKIMEKVYLVWVFIAEIEDQFLYAVCGNADALEKCKAEILKDGYNKEDIRVDEASVRN